MAASERGQNGTPALSYVWKLTSLADGTTPDVGAKDKLYVIDRNRVLSICLSKPYGKYNRVFRRNSLETASAVALRVYCLTLSFQFA